MVRKVVLSFAFLAISVFGNRASAQGRVDWNTAIERTFLKSKLEEFSGAVSTTINGKPVTIRERGSEAGRDLARQYLAQEYTQLGFQVSLHNYKGGANFIAEKTGTNPSKVLILSSHIDSVGNAGADDNGSGTISALAIARILAPLKLQYTLRVVGFDQEEPGTIGSIQYVKNLLALGQLKTVLADINLEMTGYDSDNNGAFHIIDCDRADSVAFTSEVMNAMTALSLPLQRSPACTDRSDHASFWENNVPAIVVAQDFFGGDDNPCYHEICDKVDKINFTYMRNVTTAVGVAVASILKAQ